MALNINVHEFATPRGTHTKLVCENPSDASEVHSYKHHLQSRNGNIYWLCLGCIAAKKDVLVRDPLAKVSSVRTSGPKDARILLVDPFNPDVPHICQTERLALHISKDTVKKGMQSISNGSYKKRPRLEFAEALAGTTAQFAANSPLLNEVLQNIPAWGQVKNKYYKAQAATMPQIRDLNNIPNEMQLTLTNQRFLDQMDNVGAHTQRGIDFLTQYGNFINERSQIENSYALKLRKLADKYHKGISKKNDEDNKFSYVSAFDGMLVEVKAMAAQHERVAEAFKDEAFSKVITAVNEMTRLQKTYLSEAEHMQQKLNNSYKNLETIKREFHDACKRAQAQTLKFKKADGDLNLSRAAVENERQKMVSKSQIQEQARLSYASQLQRTNDDQYKFYHENLPAVLERLRELDQRRITEIQNLMLQCVQHEELVQPVVAACLKEMGTQANNIDGVGDSQLVVSRFQSGYKPPEDIPFFNVTGSDDGIDGTNGHGTVYPHERSSETIDQNGGGVVSGGIAKYKPSMPRKDSFNPFKSKQKHKPDGTYANEPPMQRCNRIREKLEDVQRQIEKVQKQRGGVEKMVDLYTRQPNLGNRSQPESEMRQLDQELAQLQAEDQKFQTLLVETEKLLHMPINQAYQNGGGSAYQSPVAPRNSVDDDDSRRSNSTNKRNSSDQDSIDSTRSTSEASGSAVPVRPAATYPTNSNNYSSRATEIVSPQNDRICSNNSSTTSPQNGLGALRQKFLDGNRNNESPYEEEEEDFELVQDAVFCVAMFEFEQDAEGTIGINVGERLEQIEKDEGDGWTKVRKGNLDEGFVPTSFIQLESSAR